MAMIEDDMRLHQEFAQFVDQAARAHLPRGPTKGDNPPELLQLGPYGEGYGACKLTGAVRPCEMSAWPACVKV